jgi:hypothetical protein
MAQTVKQPSLPVEQNKSDAQAPANTAPSPTYSDEKLPGLLGVSRSCYTVGEHGSYYSQRLARSELREGVDQSAPGIHNLGLLEAALRTSLRLQIKQDFTAAIRFNKMGFLEVNCGGYEQERHDFVASEVEKTIRALARV